MSVIKLITSPQILDKLTAFVLICLNGFHISWEAVWNKQWLVLKQVVQQNLNLMRAADISMNLFVDWLNKTFTNYMQCIQLQPLPVEMCAYMQLLASSNFYK